MPDPVVEVETGRLRGTRRGAVSSFRGIPYAAPPVGTGRFAPPLPPAPWTGERDAAAAGPAAPQNPSMLERLLGSERELVTDEAACLTCNVWTPGPDHELRPVLVWIHGGAFVTGSGSVPWYDGSRLAEAGDVVVVTLNYRLGALGFLHLAELGGEPFAGSGNVGLLDQVAALRWVQRNIAAFGGDPDTVTVFGESAGGMSVGCLLGMPAARGLFHRAVPQSGAASNVRSSQAATQTAELFLHELGVDHTDVSALRALPVDRILAAQASVAARSGPRGLPFQPVLDGTVLARPPLEVVADGGAHGVALLAGTTTDEMRLFTAFDPSLAELDAEGLERRLEGLLGERAHEALSVYAAGLPGARPADVWAAVLTDSVFRQPAIRLAEAHAAHDARTWMYRFGYPSPAFGGSLGACHAIEIPFVFDNLDAPGASLLTGDGDDRHALARATSRAWLAFARHGDPNHDGLPEWPAYDGERRATMLLEVPPRISDDPEQAQRLLWAG